jgi:hypothetical protein
MFNITLFCTRHGETGNCNIFELYKIITHLKPEVIFEEIPPSLFEEHYINTPREKLETNAIKLYLLDHQIKHIPVDLDEIMPQDFWDDNKIFFEEVEKINPEFCKLCDYDSQYARQYGFNYLNSIYCIKINNDKNKEMENTIKELNNEKLYGSYELWKTINDKRENEMIMNIYKYCNENKFNKGLFFIGAAHRESIINKIKIFNKAEKLNIEWNYFEYNNDVNIVSIGNDK